jgi:hypothetical protein
VAIILFLLGCYLAYLGFMGVMIVIGATVNTFTEIITPTQLADYSNETDEEREHRRICAGDPEAY